MPLSLGPGSLASPLGGGGGRLRPGCPRRGSRPGVQARNAGRDSGRSSRQGAQRRSRPGVQAVLLSLQESGPAWLAALTLALGAALPSRATH